MKDKNINNLDIKLNLYPKPLTLELGGISKLNQEFKGIIKLNSNKDIKKIHEYHLVENSPWPIYITISILSIILSIILIFNNTNIYNSFFYKLFIFLSL